MLRQLVLILIGQPTHPGNTPAELRRKRVQVQQKASQPRQSTTVLQGTWVIVRELLYAVFAQPK